MESSTNHRFLIFFYREIIQLLKWWELLLIGNNEKLIKARVDLGGNINIPEIGSIQIANITLLEANKKIEKIIESIYIGTDSYLSVTKPSLRKISVVGSVMKPGTYIVNPFVTISEAIKYAGGLQQNASIRTITETRWMVILKAWSLWFLINGDSLKY